MAMLMNMKLFFSLWKVWKMALVPLQIGQAMDIFSADISCEQ